MMYSAACEINEKKQIYVVLCLGFRDQYNGFWIDWLIGFIGTSLQLQPIITVHNQCLSKICSIPCWITSVFSSTVTDLVLIYESVTSSASVILWLTLHSWTLNY
jgi:hypothetical protein